MGDTIPQLSIPPIPILLHAVSILGSLQFRYDTLLMWCILVYLEHVEHLCHQRGFPRLVKW